MTQTHCMRPGRTVSSGFTLIELLIVVAIIGILAAIAVPNFLNAQIKAKVARVQSDIRSLISACEMYRVDHNSYPPDGDDLENFNPQDFHSAARMRLLTTPISYISSLPLDPFHTEIVEFPGFELLFPGDPPYTYAYNSFGTFTGDGFQPANHGKPDNIGISSMGPNKIFDAVVGYPILYNASNGIVSDGDITMNSGNRTPLSQ